MNYPYSANYIKPIKMLTLLALSWLMSTHAYGQTSKKQTPEPSIDEAMEFLISQIELHSSVESVTRIGSTSIRLKRRAEILEFDFVDFDERYTSGAESILNCARKGCVALISESEGKPVRFYNNVWLNASSSDRAERINRAARLIYEKLAKKPIF